MTELQAKHPARRAALRWRTASGAGSHYFVACSMRLRRGLRIGGVLLAAVCSASVFGQTLQFDASAAANNSSGTSNTVASWTSVRGGVVMSPAHGQSNGWTRATLVTGAWQGVNFATNTASPLHAEGATNTVAAAFAVVRCTEPADLGTLLDAPASARFATRHWPGEPRLLALSQLGSATLYRVNGVATNRLEAAEHYQLVEVSWPEPVALADIYVGGAVPSPAWRRAWPGELAELIFLGSTPSSAEREALGYYAARKWGAPVDASGTNAREALDGLGVSHGTLFTLILIIR